jgi:hypothetical protein
MAPAAILTWLLCYWIIDSPREREWAMIWLAVPAFIVVAVLPFAGAYFHRSWKVLVLALLFLAGILGLAISMEMLFFVIGGGIRGR